MPAVTIRNISDETHRALKLRASSHGRSTEAEIREILEQAVRPIDRFRMGSAISELSREAGVENDDVSALENGLVRDPATPVRFD